MDASLFRLWMATVERDPSAVAVIEASTGRRWTRAALAAGAGQWADSFVRSAKRPPHGRRVAMSVPNGAGWLQVFLGIMAAGAIPDGRTPSRARPARAPGPPPNAWSR